MNAEGLMSAGGLSKKIVSFLVLVLLDIGFSSYIIFIDISKKLASSKNVNEHDVNSEVTIAIILSGVQLLVHFLLIFWYFFLVWKTFLFRFGKLSKLSSQFPILYLAPLNFLAFTFDRALRYVSFQNSRF